MLSAAIRRLSLRPSTSAAVLTCRWRQKDRVEYAKDQWERRALRGDEAPVHPSRFPAWDRGVELSALSARISHRFDSPAQLNDVFRPETRSELAFRGAKITRTIMGAWLRQQFPRLPEEGIQVLVGWLVREEMMAFLGRHLGLAELVEDPPEWPITDALAAETFQALIGALPSPRELLLLILAPQIHGEDLSHLAAPKDPMGLLCHLLPQPPQPRLLRQSGSLTAFPVFVVGLYVDGEELIGESAGESAAIAEEMAARDALRGLWGLREDRAPLSFHPKAPLDLEARNAGIGPEWAWLEPQRDNGLEEKWLDMEAAYERYSKEVEPELGVPRRMRQRHMYSRGTRNRRNFRRLNPPLVSTIT